MKLVWHSNQSKVLIHQIEIQISPENLQPFPISAIVEEQDTSLILEPSTEIHYPGDKPLWYMANTAELQQTYQPGDVILKSGSPLRLWAIVHDLDHNPSWRSEWIDQALENILILTEEKAIAAIRLPVLGAQFGHFSLPAFITLLGQVLNRNKLEKLQQIWLVIPPEACHKAFDLLKKFSHSEQ